MSKAKCVSEVGMAGNGSISTELSTDRQFWQELYACLTDKASVKLTLDYVSNDHVSLAKMHGFTSIQIDQNSGAFTAQK